MEWKSIMNGRSKVIIIIISGGFGDRRGAQARGTSFLLIKGGELPRFLTGRVSSLQSPCAQDRRHFVFLSRRQTDRCRQDIARLDTEELRPFAIG
jgi:hypothetical protein